MGRWMLVRTSDFDVLGQGVGVGRHRTEHEQRHQGRDQRASGLPAPGQEDRQPGQGEQGEVPRVERAVVGQRSTRTAAGTLTDAAAPAAQLTIAHRSRRECVSAAGLSGVAGQHQLLPQPIRMLPGELAGQFVEAAHPLHRDEERLVWAQACGDEFVDGAAEMVFEFVDVGRLQLPAAEHVLAPLARTAPPTRPDPAAPSCRAPQRDRRRRPAVAEPDLLERVGDRVPLAALLGQLSQALVGDAVVLAPPLAG